LNALFYHAGTPFSEKGQRDRKGVELGL